MRGKTQEDIGLVEMLDPVAESVGYEIVRLRLMGGAEQRRLQIMAERPLQEDGSGGDMNVEDCAKLSRAISEIMDAADPISGEYTLEVSSPGVDRPLTRLKDFDTYAGLEVRIELDRVAEGRKRFKGELAGVEDGQVGLNLEGEDDTTVYFPFEWIVDAKLVLTDQLMKRGAEQRAARVGAEGEDADTDHEDLGDDAEDDIDLSESEED
ncbi:ribosome maturation factor RimP [Caulobacter sp. Root655]|uniref:ribosome maturation factor RimP n=1 Tax=Caulobacter sp. Root655 TaxID=1736578 RepID=UPI0006F5A310|nr:ribosome maturation factor RimP [Caulobacter sp. Root655]KRA56133.1 ribosome maturation factor RimP [Caulobacter sp. Root655]